MTSQMAVERVGGTKAPMTAVERVGELLLANSTPPEGLQDGLMGAHAALRAQGEDLGKQRHYSIITVFHCCLASHIVARHSVVSTPSSSTFHRPS